MPQRQDTAGGPLRHLPPHLREVCGVLAVGLVRLRRHSAAAGCAVLGGEAESSLHFTARQSGHGLRNPAETP